MKKTYVFILTVSVFLILSCSNTKSTKQQEWDQIKGSQDFAKYFNFSLTLTNSQLLEEVIDSIERVAPKDMCYKLTNHIGNNLETFTLIDDCHYPPSYKSRNILNIYIDENDKITSEYNFNELKNYEKRIIQLNMVNFDSYDFPEIDMIEIEDSKYYRPKFVVFMWATILPDTLIQKTSWGCLIKTTKSVLKTYLKVKEIKSKNEFNKNIDELTDKERIIINKIVRGFIQIRFFKRGIPPPPPPKTGPPAPEPLPLNLKNFK